MAAPALGIVAKPHFSQSTVVIAAIAAAWLLWLAANNKLLTYWQILLGQGAATASGTGAGGAAPAANPNPTGQQLYNVPSTTGNFIPYPFNQPAQ